MSAFAVVLAAGKSERFGADKLWMNVRGRPLWTLSYETLRSHPAIKAVGIVCQTGRVGEFRALAPSATFVTEGGVDRQASSKIGVDNVPASFDTVLIHDAARCNLPPEVIDRVLEGVDQAGAAVPAVPLTDSVRQRTEEGWRSLDRGTLVAVQTPQGAWRSLLVRAHQEAQGSFTDEASLIEALGVPVACVPGDPQNIKVTHPGDVSRILGGMETRSGLGYDVHRFSTDPDRDLWLGGVLFPDKPGLDGHSDADALLHAVVDALLGAAGLGDIGLLYPNTDPQWAGVRSTRFLAETADRLRDAGWEIVNIDATVIAERPKVMPQRDKICAAIAQACGIDPTRVSVKATTNEGLGAIGRGEGVSAFATAQVRTRQD